MEQKVTKLAIQSRLFIIVLQYIANIIIPDHDANVFLYPNTNKNYTLLDKSIQHFLGGFLRWDAQYFMHIAKYGYTYENTLAFFPLYPLAVRYISAAVNKIFPFMSFDSTLLATFILFNVILFVLASKLLFKLTKLIFDEAFSYKSTFLFCINPASIFFSAPYSECLFCYLTLQSMLNCMVFYKKCSDVKHKVNYSDILYIFPISLSAVVRSNGVLNIGFLIYTYICICIKYWPKYGLVNKLRFFVKYLFVLCILVVICLIPFSIYQIYCYLMFCTNINFEFWSSITSYAEMNDFVLPGQFFKHNQSWCYNKIPLAYSYVQNHYWNVGFFKYYEFKQIPNFLVALPVLIILIKESYEHLLCNASKNIVDVFSFDRLLNKKQINNVRNPVINVFVIHILFLSLFCLLFVHIQVSTRMLCSSSPILYWYCTSVCNDKKLYNFKYLLNGEMSLQERAVIIYFLSYFLVGTVMFCNFLPWT